MERSTQLWIGVVVLAALGGAVYKVSKDDATKGTATTTSADLPEIKATDDIDKISITNADKGETVLEKKGDKWEVTKPVTAPANQANVKQLIDNMKELKAKEVITTAPSDDQKKEFQFEKDKDVHVVAWKGAEKKVDATFGKSGARGQMMMVEGKPGIYVAGGYSSYLYARETKGWRDTEIFKFDDANANQLTIATKAGTLSFTKGDKWAGTFKDKPIADLDEEKVKDAVRAFKALNAEDFGDGKMPVDVLPTLSTYLPAWSLSEIVTVPSGLSRPVSAADLPSPKSSALRALNARTASLTFSSSRSAMGLLLNVPDHLSPFVNESVPALSTIVS